MVGQVYLEQVATISQDIVGDEVIPSLAPARIRELSELKQIITLRKFATEWSVIALTVWITHSYFNILTYGLALLVIGSRQHGLAVLVHEAAHYRFLKNKFLNDYLANILAGWLLLISVEGYRYSHWSHHRFLNTNRDPDFGRKISLEDWTFPKSRWGIFRLLLRDLLLLNLIDQLSRLPHLWPKRNSPLGTKISRYVFGLFFFVILTHFDAWKFYLLFWVLPYFTVMKVILRVRSIAEHFALKYDSILTKTRTVACSALEEWFWAPSSVSYHLEHHLYPNVPYYNLKTLHRELMTIDGYREKAHITPSYWRLLSHELSSFPKKPSGTT